MEVKTKDGVVLDPETAEIVISNNGKVAFLLGTREEDEFACVMHGKVTYLTHDERVAIIKRRNGADYDCVPLDFTGEEVRTRVIPTWVCPSELGMAIIREWDGTLTRVYHMVPDLGYDFVDMMYMDGVTNRVTRRYFEFLKSSVFGAVQEANEYW